MDYWLQCLKKQSRSDSETRKHFSSTHCSSAEIFSKGISQNVALFHEAIPDLSE